MFASASRSLRDIIHYLGTLSQRRPTIEPQTESADCGYVCISAILALLGRPTPVDEVKGMAGTTARGLTLKQLRDGLRACGVDAEAIRFDQARANSYPNCGVLLLCHGHYIVVARRKGDRFEIFDPEFGWSWTSRRKLNRDCGGLAVDVRGLAEPSIAATNRRRPGLMSKSLKAILVGRAGRAAVATFALAQLVTLALPLLSMWSVDRSIEGLSAGFLGAVAIGFVALSITNVFISLVGELIQTKTKRLAAVAISKVAFDSLAQKPAYWFDLNSSASLQNRVGSLYTQLDFYIELIRAVGTLVVTLIVGLAALLFISPWLLVPGLCSLLLSVMLDLLFDRALRNQFASSVKTFQRRQAFVLDTLYQLPLIARFGSLNAVRVKFASLVRSTAAIEAKLQSLRGWRGALGNLSKSGETLFFVTLSAAFMARGNFTIGGFVALGAYKDLIANALGTVFQLVLRRRSLEVHALQAAALLTADGHKPAAGSEVSCGDVRFEAVAFAYGSLDRPVLANLSFHIAAGECVVIRGASGSGKSTIARLIVGNLKPTQGMILIDGQPLADHVPGMSAVLQSDRLIDGSIRENVIMFRRNVTDDEVFGALKLAAIDDFVLSLPMGLHTRIGEAVSGLSGGQRQRLLIARAALGHPRLIILDEATSSLEVEVEAKILQALGNSGATTVLMAHRPEVWALADRIFTLDGGKLQQERVTLRGMDSVGAQPAE